MLQVGDRAYEEGADGWHYCREHNCCFRPPQSYCHCWPRTQAGRRAAAAQPQPPTISLACAADLSDPPHVVEYAIVIKRIDAALKETP